MDPLIFGRPVSQYLAVLTALFGVGLVAEPNIVSPQLEGAILAAASAILFFIAGSHTTAIAANTAATDVTPAP